MDNVVRKTNRLQRDGYRLIGSIFGGFIQAVQETFFSQDRLAPCGSTRQFHRQPSGGHSAYLSVTDFFFIQISRIEYIHSNSFVHRDIKPANFVMGTGKSAHLVNIIDFGLAKKFRDSRTSTHIPYKQNDFHGVGTSLFAAINTHLGVGARFLSFWRLLG